MLSINTNLSSLIVQSNLKQSTNSLNTAIERMTTGCKLNHASDNAANYSIATNMQTKLGAYQVAEENAMMGLDMLQTGESSLNQISDKLSRLRALIVQANNGTYGTQSLSAINSESNALVDEISRLYSTAEYNGIKLFSDSASADSAPAIATYAMRARAASFGYSQEEIDAMTTLSEAYEAGAFVEDVTYSISSEEELAKFAELVNAGNSGAGSTFVLTKDLDLSGISNWTPIGYSVDVSKFFSGVFDGNGHVISNLKINDTSGAFQGLFGLVGSFDPNNYVEIKNLGLENVNINGGELAGALAGMVLSAGTVNISNNYSTGTVNISNSNSPGMLGLPGSGAGGLVGMIFSQADSLVSFDNNYSTATVNAISTAGGLVGNISTMNNSSVTLCNNFATGDVSAQSVAGGLLGSTSINTGGSVSLYNNFVTGDINGTDNVGGLIGEAYCNNGESSIENNYATGSVIGSFNIGGFIGGVTGNAPTVTNCASVQADTYVIQMSVNEILAPTNLESMDFTNANGWTIKNGLPVLTWQSASSGGGATGPLVGSNSISLQVGIGASNSSQIGIDLGFSLGAVDDLRMIGLDTTTDFLSIVDEMIATVNAKEVEYGAASNRLESVLEEISTQYENLVSSLSTIRDADMAEVSSEYIKQQILQQASATLMATANQTPAIALQLL